MCAVRPGMAEVYQYVDANGKTVFLISRRQVPRQSR
jgi:predicted secreted acid phosphatase